MMPATDRDRHATRFSVSDVASENSEREHFDLLLDQLSDFSALGSVRCVVWGSDKVAVALARRIKELQLGVLLVGCFSKADEVPSNQVDGITILSTADLIAAEPEAIVVSSDVDKEMALLEMSSLVGAMGSKPRIFFAGTRHYQFRDPVFDEILRGCTVKSKAGGNEHMLIHIYQSLRSVALRRLPGDIAEFGVFRAGTTVFMAKVMAHFGHPKRIIGFDTFSGFPPARSHLDLFHDPKYADVDARSVRSYCAPYNIELIEGDIRDTIGRLDRVPLAFSFFDTDNYSSVTQALELCMRQTVVGGMIAFDHFFSPKWPLTIGERIAAAPLVESPDFLNLHGTGIFHRVR